MSVASLIPSRIGTMRDLSTATWCGPRGGGYGAAAVGIWAARGAARKTTANRCDRRRGVMRPYYAPEAVVSRTPTCRRSLAELSVLHGDAERSAIRDRDGVPLARGRGGSE